MRNPLLPLLPATPQTSASPQLLCSKDGDRICIDELRCPTSNSIVWAKWIRLLALSSHSSFSSSTLFIGWHTSVAAANHFILSWVFSFLDQEYLCRLFGEVHLELEYLCRWFKYFILYCEHFLRFLMKFTVMLQRKRFLKFCSTVRSGLLFLFLWWHKSWFLNNCKQTKSIFWSEFNYPLNVQHIHDKVLKKILRRRFYFEN